MVWRWNWNGLWTAGAISLILNLVADVPMAYRLALYPICIVLFGLHRREPSSAERVDPSLLR